MYLRLIVLFSCFPTSPSFLQVEMWIGISLCIYSNDNDADLRFTPITCYCLSCRNGTGTDLVEMWLTGPFQASSFSSVGWQLAHVLKLSVIHLMWSRSGFRYSLKLAMSYAVLTICMSLKISIARFPFMF